MVKDCKSYDLPDPVWREDGCHLVLEFSGIGIGEGVSNTLIANVAEGVNAELCKLVTLIDATPGMNAKQLAVAIVKVIPM